MADLLFVANPAARGFTGGLYRRIKTLLAKEHSVTHAWPTSPKEVEEVVADAATRGVDRVVVMGGDGVVHHAAQPLVSGETSLGIVPAGTANVLAKVLGLPERPMSAARLIADGGDIDRIPVARLTMHRDDRPTTHYATFNIGVGYDADVVSKAEAGPERKARLGTIHYAGSALETVWAYRRRRPMMSVTIGDRQMPAVMAAIQIHDTYTYFGRVPMVVGPATPLSGIVVAKLGMARATSMALRSFRGRIEPTEAISQFSGASAAVIEGTSDVGIPVQADGEWLGVCDRLELELAPAALPVVGSSKK